MIFTLTQIVLPTEKVYFGSILTEITIMLFKTLNCIVGKICKYMGKKTRLIVILNRDGEATARRIEFKSSGSE